jgi:hypothetical protein
MSDAAIGRFSHREPGFCAVLRDAQNLRILQEHSKTDRIEVGVVRASGAYRATSLPDGYVTELDTRVLDSVYHEVLKSSAENRPGSWQSVRSDCQPATRADHPNMSRVKQDRLTAERSVQSSNQADKYTGTVHESQSSGLTRPLESDSATGGCCHQVYGVAVAQWTDYKVLGGNRLFAD